VIIRLVGPFTHPYSPPSVPPKMILASAIPWNGAMPPGSTVAQLRDMCRTAPHCRFESRDALACSLAGGMQTIIWSERLFMPLP
jgi:hypothetical protein